MISLKTETKNIEFKKAKNGVFENLYLYFSGISGAFNNSITSSYDSKTLSNLKTNLEILRLKQQNTEIVSTLNTEYLGIISDVESIQNKLLNSVSYHTRTVKSGLVYDIYSKLGEIIPIVNQVIQKFTKPFFDDVSYSNFKFTIPNIEEIKEECTYILEDVENGVNTIYIDDIEDITHIINTLKNRISNLSDKQFLKFERNTDVIEAKMNYLSEQISTNNIPGTNF